MVRASLLSHEGPFDSSFDSNKTMEHAKVEANTTSATVGATVMISAFRRVSTVSTKNFEHRTFLSVSNRVVLEENLVNVATGTEPHRGRHPVDVSLSSDHLRR